ncbi:hypothetical protein A2886_00830 [candidate division WWE3 bacterium RIFCSPHIGHO2_01_FULL_42_13]|uniref:Uncharacterized protein n=1 Tax=candidate division WWE3 bacterium RIFCSPHIGHO2_01_FULL_42_13 TaxID=1802617 RepID=A0A1F4UQE6_UNCKA|nr:MAG: hypothetical protein A2886_00830 [candidate division WWE3 bacterium RIFCSPHIGHO2_01_FULL_42_13]
MARVRRAVYISLASLFPISWGWGWSKRLLELLSEIEYTGVQMLPFRGQTRSSLAKFPARLVIAYEGAWNTGSLLSALKRLSPKYGGEKDPSLVDWTLFGGESAAKRRLDQFRRFFPYAIHVRHEGNKSAIVEANPELGWEWDKYFQQAGLVIDTWHIRRAANIATGKSILPVTNTEESYLSFLRQASTRANVRLLHLQPRRDDGGKELGDFLTGRPNLLTEAVRVLRAPVVVEIKPSPFYSLVDPDVYKIDLRQIARRVSAVREAR